MSPIINQSLDLKRVQRQLLEGAPIFERKALTYYRNMKINHFPILSIISPITLTVTTAENVAIPTSMNNPIILTNIKKAMLETKKETILASKGKKSPVAINALKMQVSMKTNKSIDTWITCKKKSIMF